MKIAPIAPIARTATTHSTVSGRKTATRSPRATPSLRKPAAMRATSAESGAGGCARGTGRWAPTRNASRHGTTARRSASDGVEEPIEVQPNDTRVAPYKRRGDEEEPVGEDQHHEEIPARREENSEEDEPQHRYPDRITRDHRAGPVAALAFETEPAYRTVLVHREDPTPDPALQAARATAGKDRGEPSH